MILGPILFNKNFYKWLVSLVNLIYIISQMIRPFSVTCNNLNNLLYTLEKESESAVDWSKKNNMITNPYKFQAIIMNKGKDNQITHSLKIYNNETETTKSARLLGIGIDNDPSFNMYIYIYMYIYKRYVLRLPCRCSKPAMQLNAIWRLEKFLENNEKLGIINSFVYFSFN